MYDNESRKKDERKILREASSNALTFFERKITMVYKFMSILKIRMFLEYICNDILNVQH